MFRNVIFYNHFGAGDLFESREFIKDIMSLASSEKYVYAHGKNPKMFCDIPNLDYMNITQVMQPKSSHILSNDDLYINTWIGRDSKYVLSQVGCVIDKNYEMFNDTLSKIGLGRLSGNIMDYLPTIDFSCINTGVVDEFVGKSRDFSKLVLVCNGNVNSSQAENFDFTPSIARVASTHSDMLFIVTHDVGYIADNVVTSSSITKSTDGFDLNEISYLATYCDIIVGRKSGPFVFAHTKEVWMDGAKKSLSFTYAKHSSHFVEDDSLPLRKFWSPATGVDEVTQRIEEVLNG